MDDNITCLFEDISECYSFLDKYFTSEPDIPMSIGGVPRSIDYIVAHYLVGKSHIEWLVKNDIGPYQIGGTSELVLKEFVSEEKVFMGRSGKFRIYENVRDSVKHFFAKPVE
jgi:hypothetical protein